MQIHVLDAVRHCLCHAMHRTEARLLTNVRAEGSAPGQYTFYLQKVVGRTVFGVADANCKPNHYIWDTTNNYSVLSTECSSVVNGEVMECIVTIRSDTISLDVNVIPSAATVTTDDEEPVIVSSSSGGGSGSTQRVLANVSRAMEERFAFPWMVVVAMYVERATLLWSLRDSR